VTAADLPFAARLAAESAIRAVRSKDTARFERTLRLAAEQHKPAIWEHCRANEPHLTLVTANPGLNRWGLANWQRRVLEDTASRILIRGGNKIGKSLQLAEECALFLDGQHPTRQRPTDRPARILYVVADMQNAYADDVCRTLREVIAPQKLSGRTKYDEVKGYTVSGQRSILWHDGSQIMFRSGTQDGQAIAGLWCDLVIVNEPPMVTRWGEIMRAAALYSAPVIVGFTPVDSHGASRDLLWLRDIVEGAPGTPTPLGPDGKPAWSQHVITLCPENVPHRRPEDVLQQIADMPEWEVAQRRDAAWEGPALGRSLSAFSPVANVFQHSPGQWDALPGSPGQHALRFGVTADHGERANKEVIIFWAWAGSGEDLRCWVLDCYVSPTTTSIAKDAEAVCQMLARHTWRGEDRMCPDDIDEAIGDTNSSGKGDMTTATVNEAFTKAWAELGYSLTMKPADKGASSVGLGVRTLNDAFARQRLWISSTAAEIIHAASRWQGGNGETHKDKIDPLRYGPGAKFKTIRTRKRAVQTPHKPVVDMSWADGGVFTGEGGM
jgi:hypothetical protein